MARLIIFETVDFRIPKESATSRILPSSVRWYNDVTTIVSPLKLDLEIWFCVSECKVSAQCIISQNFLETCGNFLSIPQRLPDRRKNYPIKSWSVRVESEISRNFFCPSFWKIWDGWWDDLVNYFVSFCCFFTIKKLKKVCNDSYQPYKLFKQRATSITFLFST